MIRAIIFDSDDTLIDFSGKAVKCIQETAIKLNLKPYNKNDINKLWGRSLKYIVKELYGKKYYRKFKKIYFRIINKIKFKELKGARIVIKLLKNNYFLGVLSAKPSQIMFKNFKDAGFHIKDFKFAFSADDTKFHKPSPRVFDKAKKILRKYKISNNEVIYVGDALIDYLAAKSAGLKFIAVTQGYYKKNDFIKIGLKKENILNSIRLLPYWLSEHGNN